jgi:hypothetical protein
LIFRAYAFARSSKSFCICMCNSCCICVFICSSSCFWTSERENACPQFGHVILLDIKRRKIDNFWWL